MGSKKGAARGKTKKARSEKRERAEEKKPKNGKKKHVMPDT
jgi:hypothetical protein